MAQLLIQPLCAGAGILLAANVEPLRRRSRVRMPLVFSAHCCLFHAAGPKCVGLAFCSQPQASSDAAPISIRPRLARCPKISLSYALLSLKKVSGNLSRLYSHRVEI